jgi:tetratricopeptide (TPR) repeat protein
MNKIALIEKYFSNQLTKKELESFNSLYTNDLDFKAEIDFLKGVKLVSEKNDTEQFKKQIASYETEFVKKQINPFAKWIKPVFAVAAVILLGFCIQFLLNTSVDEETLFATYYEPCKNVSVPIVRSEENETILKNAFIAYSEMDYKKANTLFENAIKINKNSELLFYQGNTLLALGDAENAIEKFKEHLKYTDELTNRSHWYLALAYLKLKQLENAKQELNTFIKSPESFKKLEATSLLKKLE